MTIVNPANQFGTSDFIVDPVLGVSPYTTIQAAVTAANAAGGGTIYIRPGVYAESITWPAGIAVVGADTGISANINPSIEIQGVQTFQANGNIAFSNILFTGSNIWNVTPSTAAFRSNIQFTNCKIQAAAGFGITVASGIGSAFALLLLNNSTVTSISDTIIIGLNGTLSSQQASVVSNGGNCVNIADVTATVFSTDSSYTELGGTGTGFNFVAAGTVYTFYDQMAISASTGFYASGVAGSIFNYAYVTIFGTASAIDPTITATAFQAPIPPFAWTDVSTNIAIRPGIGYFATSGTPILTLPATSIKGDTFKVCLNGATSWTIAQNAGQQIKVADKATTAGVGGSIVSTAQGDLIELVCSVANTEWVAAGALIGNLTII